MSAPGAINPPCTADRLLKRSYRSALHKTVSLCVPENQWGIQTGPDLASCDRANVRSRKLTWTRVALVAAFWRLQMISICSTSAALAPADSFLQSGEIPHRDSPARRVKLLTTIASGDFMTIKKSTCALTLTAAAGLGMWAIGAYAQNASSPQDTSQAAASSSDMVGRVKQALHAEPALNDKHIEVSLKNGKVVMRGFVTSQGDMVKAVRAASKTAGGKNVVNELTIQREDESNSTS